MKTKFLALAFAALAPFAVMADDVSYGYFDLSYQTGSVDPVDFDGFRLSLSYPINDSWYVAFDYADLSFDPTGDLSDYSIAAGWHNELFFAEFGYEDADANGFSDSGFEFDAGVRSMVSENFELSAHLGYSDLGSFDTFTKYGVGAVWMFGDNMGVSFNYDLWSADSGSDLDTMGVGFRFNF